MLEKKWRENDEAGKDWMRKAEIAVDKSKNDWARAALDRFQTSQRLAQSYREQVDDQKLQVETLKGALVKLEQKLDEAKSKRDLLLARHRRGIALGKAARAQTAMGDNSKSATFDRLKDRVHHTEAVATAEVELLTDDVGEKLTRLDRDAEVDRLLADLKARRGLPALRAINQPTTRAGHYPAKCGGVHTDSPEARSCANRRRRSCTSQRRVPIRLGSIRSPRALRVSRRGRREGTAKGPAASKSCVIAGKENVRRSNS